MTRWMLQSWTAAVVSLLVKKRWNGRGGSQKSLPGVGWSTVDVLPGGVMAPSLAGVSLSWITSVSVCLAADHSVIWTDPQSVGPTRIPSGSFGCSHRSGRVNAIKPDNTEEERVFWRVRAAVSVIVTLSYGCNQDAQVIWEGRRLSPGAQRRWFSVSCLSDTLTT